MISALLRKVSLKITAIFENIFSFSAKIPPQFPLFHKLIRSPKPIMLPFSTDNYPTLKLSIQSSLLRHQHYRTLLFHLSVEWNSTRINYYLFLALQWQRFEFLTLFKVIVIYLLPS